MYTLSYILHIYIPNQTIIVAKVMFLLLNVIECKTLRSIHSLSLVFHNACFE